MKEIKMRGFVRGSLAAFAIAAVLMFAPASAMNVYAATQTQALAETDIQTEESEVLGAKRLLVAEETMNTYPGLIIILVASIGTAISAVTPRIVVKKYM
jgi:hypothetical protein